MTSTWILISAGIAWVALCLLAAEWLFSSERRIARRIREETSREDARSTSSLFRDWGLVSDDDDNINSQLKQIIEQSGVAVSVKQIIAVSVAIACFTSVMGSLFHSWGWILGVPALFMPMGVVYILRYRRMATLSRQLPEAFDLMRRAVEAGQSVPSAFEQVASQCRDPLASEFASCSEQHQLGLSYDAALRNLAKRVSLTELRILVIALTTQRQCGGSPVDILENLSALIRKRQKFAQRVSALTAEGRLQAMVLSALPVVTFFGLYILRPGYLAPLLDEPRLLLIASGLQIVGMIWVRRTVQLDY